MLVTGWQVPVASSTADLFPISPPARILAATGIIVLRNPLFTSYTATSVYVLLQSPCMLTVLLPNLLYT